MKKILLLSIFSFLILGGAYAQTITIAGTGCDPIGGGVSPVDGTYTLNGTQNGKNTYLDANSWHQIEWTGTQWIIDYGASQIIYTNPTDAGVNPPATGWSAGLLSCAGSPAPIMSGNGLPVELIFFKAEQNSQGVILNWQTASEVNNEKFEIERSTDGNNFRSIKFVDGSGTSTELQSYNYIDRDIRSGQLYYYRLRQIDYSGRFDFSEVVTAKIEGIQNSGMFSPNPTTDGLIRLDYSSSNNGELSINVFDVTGKLLHNQYGSLVKGNNQIDLNLADLNAGMYFVKLNQGNNSSYEKIIIDK